VKLPRGDNALGDTAPPNGGVLESFVTKK